jgi:hypothetical protein
MGVKGCHDRSIGRRGRDDGPLAEAVRFELTDGCPSPVFKTGALNRSATLPGCRRDCHPNGGVSMRARRLQAAMVRQKYSTSDALTLAAKKPLRTSSS